MTARIVEEGPEQLEAYASVPIRFVVGVRCVVGPGPGRTLTEVPVDPPYVYDYDAFEPPSHWRTWDLRRWGFFAAFDGPHRVAGAAVAMDTPGLDLLEGRADVACLWDIRVDPERRGTGLGRALCDRAIDWAARRGARLLKVETQDINAPACRFYAGRGFRLREVNPRVYADHPDQTQLIWVRPLGPAIPASGTGL